MCENDCIVFSCVFHHFIMIDCRVMKIKKKKWIKNIERQQVFDETSLRFCVCSDHFESHAVIKHKGKLTAIAPPTIFTQSIILPSQKDVVRTPITVERYGKN